MQFNLRRAHQVRSLIESALVASSADILRPLTVQILDEKVDEKIRKAEAEAVAENEKANRLEDILGSLRLAISSVNKVAGVDEKLAQQAVLKRKVTRLSQLAVQAEDSADDLRIRLAQAKGAFERSSGTDRYNNSRESVSGYILPNSLITEAKGLEVQYRREIRKLADELLGLNFNAKVEIADSDISYLEQQGII